MEFSTCCALTEGGDDCPMTRAETEGVKPLRDTVWVLPDEPVKDVAGIDGFQLADCATKKPTTGVVLAVGPGRPSEDGSRLLPMTVRVGERVYYRHMAGVIVTLGTDRDDKTRLMSEGDILGVVVPKLDEDIAGVHPSITKPNGNDA